MHVITRESGGYIPVLVTVLTIVTKLHPCECMLAVDTKLTILIKEKPILPSEYGERRESEFINGKKIIVDLSL